MNIFVLSRDAVEAAQQQCDKHVIKMVLETAQLLCSPFDAGAAPYRRTHFNHPCAIWTRQSRDNFRWLVTHGLALADEYTLRYGKTHRSGAVIQWCRDHESRLVFPQLELTPFAQAMPEQYRAEDPVKAYRAYYRGAKTEFATWRAPRTVPDWFLNQGELHAQG